MLALTSARRNFAARPRFAFVFALVACCVAAPAGAVVATDRWVAPSGVDAGDCTVQASPCETIAYAITQSASGDTVHIAEGTYLDPLTITTPDLTLTGEDPMHKPVITRLAGPTNQPLLVVAGATGVHIENLDFAMDQSFVAEGILASGFVDGLTIANNHFGSSRLSAAANSSFGYRNAISINDVRNSLSLPRVDGSAVTIDGNVIDGLGDPANGVFLRAGVNMDAGVGTISNNTIAAITHDIHVRFATVTMASSADSIVIDQNVLGGRGLEFAAPNASTAGVTISNNTISALPGIDGGTPYPADWSLVRLQDNAQNVPVGLVGNTFTGHTGAYRGVLIENFPNVSLAGNTFTPAANAPDFVSLVVSNKELNTDDPPEAPYPMTLTATSNTFAASSGAPDVGTAVEFLDDNDAAGTATFGALTFGGSGAGEANVFDGNLREYFRLDDYDCSTNTATVGGTPGGAGPLCDFLDYAGVGTLPNTEVRPFRGDVSAADNTYAGIAPAAMDAAQRNELLARTYDKAANPALGSVDYGIATPQAVVYVDDDFAGAYGGTLDFSSAAAACGNQTVHFGVDAFATIPEGIAHVQPGGLVCIAKGAYPAAVAIGSYPVRLVGDGNGASDTVITGLVTLSVGGASEASPLLLQNLRIANAGGNAVDVSAASHLKFDQVAFAGNGGVGLNLAGVSDGVVIADSLFDANAGSGVRTGTTSKISHVAITGTTFSNNAAGIILFGAAGSGNGQITDWRIDDSNFIGNDPADTSPFGGGIWLKTAGAGSLVDGFVVTHSTFADNGSSNALNRTGITVRARPGTTMQRVFICNDDFVDTPALGTQLTGINVFDDTGNAGYRPITVCANDNFVGLAHSLSGLEQHNLRGSEPIVDVIGGSIAGTEYIISESSVALTLNGPSTTVAGAATPGYTAQLTNTGSPLIENVLVDFALSRPGGLAPGDVTLEYDTGSGYAAIPLATCNGDDLCGSFGPPGTGFAVDSGYNSTSYLQFTSIRSGAITLTARVDGVDTMATYAMSSGTVAVSAAAAATIAANSATDLSGAAGTIATPLPSVKVTDDYGNPVPGYAVVFTAGTDSGFVSGANPATDADGVATLGGWTFGTAASETVAASGSTTLAGAPVTFTATVAASFDLVAGFSSAPTEAEYGATVDYVIVVTNPGPSSASNTVTDNLPAEFDASSASWICFSHSAGATCSAGGSGALSDTPTIPAGGSVTYVLSATVLTEPADETIVDQVTIGTAGDSNPSNNTATATTDIVIFADGFDGGAAPAPGAQALGTLDDASTLIVDPASASPASGTPRPWLHATDAAGRTVFRVDSLRGNGRLMARVVVAGAAHREAHSAWIALGPQAALALGRTSADARALIVLGGGDASLQVPIPASATLPLQVVVTP